MRPQPFAASRIRPPFRRLLPLTFLLATSCFAAQFRVGLVIMDRELPFWSAIEQSARQAAQAADVELTVKSLPTQNSGLEAKLITGLVAQGIDALIVAPVDARSLAPLLRDVVARHIKVVALRYPLPDDLASVLVDLDESAISRAGAEMLSKVVTDLDEVAVFRSVDRSGTGALTPRDRDAIAFVHQVHPQARIDADIFVGNVGDEARQIDALFTAHPNVTVIYTSRPFFTNAVRAALKARHLTGKIKHVGIGVGLPGSVVDDLDRGALAGWVGEQSSELGRRSVEAAVGLLKGRNVPATVTAGFIAVTPQNAHATEFAALIEK